MSNFTIPIGLLPVYRDAVALTIGLADDWPPEDVQALFNEYKTRDDLVRLFAATTTLYFAALEAVAAGAGLKSGRELLGEMAIELSKREDRI